MNKNKSLLQSFVEFNSTNRMAGAKQRCLLTVSGGIDSAVMCDIFSKARYPFAIAHCNFNLRAEESDGDEKLVRSLGKKYKVEVFVKSFDTKKYAKEKNSSTQLAARELRYAWFEEVRSANRFDFICTAHHLNDNIETIFYNLIKGTGIRGLRGIPAKQGQIIRPLLFASRKKIEAYQQQNNIAYREDSSNSSDKYTRNKIRHLLIPLMKEINPALEDTFAGNIKLFVELEELYNKEIYKATKPLFLSRGNDIYISILKLKKTKNTSSVLFEYLKAYGFNSGQIEDMLTNLNNIPGKQFLSNKARIIKDRQFFILTHLPVKDSPTRLISENISEITLGDQKLKFSVEKTEKVKIIPDKNIAFIDKSKLEFPIIVRRWKQGDYFYPFGMNMKKKKLKKFFIDEKIALNEKENIWVVESNQNIVWVVGLRSDERFKVEPETKEVCLMEFK